MRYQSKIFVLASTDVYANFLFEKYIFNTVKNDELRVIVWRNDDSVIIGRGQNPWLEANVDFLKERSVPLVRRESGGGTVFNDKGNINFSFIAGKPFYKNTIAVGVVNDVLNSMGFDTNISARNDILLKINEKEYKISGSAYRENMQKGLHHGTILVDGDLDLLRKSLHPKKINVETKSIQSVRSPVANLTQVRSDVDVEYVSTKIIEAFKNYLEQFGDVAVETVTDLPQQEDWNERISELKSWDWTFGKTPRFIQYLDGEFDALQAAVALNVNQGHVCEAEVNVPFLNQQDRQALQSALEGCAYRYSDIAGALNSLDQRIKASQWTDFKHWFMERCSVPE